MSAETLARLEHRMRRREFAPRAVIVREGSSDDSAFLVLSGRVAVRRKDLDSGIEFLLAELGEGEMFGEMALLTRKPRAASVVALEATTCGIIEQSDFDQLLAKHPTAVRTMMAALAGRLEAANRHAGIDFVNLSKVKIDPRVLRLLPQALINEHKVVPVSFANNRLTLAMTNPSNVVAFDDLRRVIKGVLIEPAVVTEDDFKRFMSSYAQLIAGEEAASEAQRQPAARPSGAPTAASQAAAPSVDLLESDLIRELQLAADTEDQTADTKQDLMSASEDAPIIKLANSILGLAIKQGASDIHIEPMEFDVTVRFRIDGVLQVVQKLPKRVQLGLISRFKILSRLDIAEKRLPQDGRISVSMDAKPIDFRVSTVPGKWGEKVCMRILDRSNTTLGLDKLINHADILKLVREMIEQPYGIIYVTGPTGSGKTTTLYSALAVEAALTGHLVFTTLHTNSAAVAFTRLHEMDVEPFLVSSSTVGVIAQRLARRLCQQCKEPVAVDTNVARFWGLAEGATIFRGKGCAACGGKGVRGRVGVYEVMKVTPRLRAMIGSAARSEEIHAAAVEEGMIDLKRYSAWLLTEGLTSVEEVTSVVSVDI